MSSFGQGYASAKHSLPGSIERTQLIFFAKDNDNDPISGEWSVTFPNGERAIHATFTFILDGKKVVGTAYSDHTGAGTIRDGKWVDDKLSFILDFKKHESVTVTGTFKNGKLTGEFITEGVSVKWEAERSSSERAVPKT